MSTQSRDRTFLRDDSLARLGSATFDILVVGGGITGAGTALDAASRGYSTALVERDDFASGTSSKSSKLIHGGLRYLQQGDVRLGIRVNGSPAGTWNAFMGTVVNDGEPYLRGGSTGLPGGFVTAPGAFSGSAEVTTTANFAMQWGVPFEVEVALFTDVYPCCLGASITSDFSQTAALTGIEAYWQGGRVTDFTGTDAVGNVEAMAASRAWTVDTMLPVTTVTGAIFVICVLTFRRGIMGEISARVPWLRR